MQRRSLDFGDTRLPERFWDRVFPEPNTGCWLWGGSTAKSGYGAFHVPGTYSGVITSHRAMMLAVDPEGIDECVMHLCDVRACVNPDHLKWGSLADNNRDMHSKGRGFARCRGVRFCIRGHEFTEDNTTVITSREGKKSRRCKRCARNNARRCRASKR